MTVMSIEPGHDIGLEVHEDHDQFLRVEAGKARVQMGPSKDDLSFDREVGDDWVILVPAGSWHNVTNIGDESLKVYSFYLRRAPHGTGTRQRLWPTPRNRLTASQPLRSSVRQRVAAARDPHADDQRLSLTGTP